MRRVFCVAGIFILALSTLACKTYGQYLTSLGGRSLGMANASVLLNDEFSQFNNPGSFVATELSFVAAFNTRYINLGINDMLAGINIPLGKFGMGAGVAYYGDHLYNQLAISAIGSHQIGISTLGIRTNYHQYHLENYGYKSSFSIDLGGLFVLSEQISLGMLIENLTRSSIDDNSQSRLSSLLQLGISFKPIPSLRLDAQIEKNIERPVSIAIGIEYQTTDVLSLRTGFNPSDAIGSVGFGLNWQKLKFDLGGQYHYKLGFSGGLSMVYTKLSK